MSERERGTTLEAIRPDHVARYEWARRQLTRFRPDRRVELVDFFCGNGYGAEVLRAGPLPIHYDGYDKSKEALEEGRRYFAGEPGEATFHQLEFDGADADSWPNRRIADVVISFESLEHVRADLAFAACVHRMLRPGGAWLVSCPNQAFLPYSREKWPHHVRHYTPGELMQLLDASGFRACLFLQNDRFIVPADPPREMSPLHLVAFAVKL